MSLPAATLFWLFAPPVILLLVTLVWAVKHWDRTP